MDLEQLASLLAVGAFLGGIGKPITQMVFPNGTKGKHTGWRWVWFATMWAHPILAGMLIGLSGYLPSPAFLDNGKDFQLGGALWYGLAGMLSSTAYYRLDSMVRGAEAEETKAPDV